MAYIPVNPERRDPGFFKKKAEIGLPSVDNMSAAEFVNAVSEDVKILGNKKKLSPKITKKGEFYGGILKTAPGNSHVEFTLGLFNSSDQFKELAAIHVDLAFSCTSSDEFGHINYTIGCPDDDPFLKNLYLVFSQVQDQIYVSLYSSNLPEKYSPVYFNILGVNFLDWTEGVEKLDPSKDISKIIKNCELSRVKLNGPSSTIGSSAADSLAVYDENGKKVSLDGVSSLEGLDYPSINGVPFLGKKGLFLGNEETGRHISIPAYHKDSTKEGSGIHDWEVLGSLRKINISKSESEATPKESSKIPNNTELGYGLVKPSKYKILPLSSVTSETIVTWLDSLGEDTDVITVGAFKEYMSYLTKVFFGSSTLSAHHLYLENSEDLFKYVPSGSSSFTLQVRSFLKKTSTSEIVPISVSSSTENSSDDWLIPGAPEMIDGIWNVNFESLPNRNNSDRDAEILITQEGTDRTIKVNVTQSSFVVKYGILLSGEIVFEDSNYYINRWGNSINTDTFTIIPIKTSNTDPRGYEEITNFQELTLTNTNTWLSGDLTEGTLSLTTESNPMSSVRTGTIYIGILENSGERFKYIPIRCSQSAATSYLKVDDIETGDIINYTVGKEETTKKILISSNYSWEVISKEIPSWISLSGYTDKRPSGISYLTLIISENNTQSKREADIEIKNLGGIKKTIKITQISRTVYIDINNQSKDQLFSFGKNEFFDLTSVTVDVKSNVNWFIDQCPEWIEPSIYDGGEQGKETTCNLTLSLKDLGYTPTGEETVSLSYYDETDKTIYSLRKIRILPSIPGFKNSSDYVLPQFTKTIEVSSNGGLVTLDSLSNVRYKLFLVEITGQFGNNQYYEDMLEGYSPETIYISEDPKPGSTQLTFEVTKNELPDERSFKFILIPEDLDPESIDPGDYPLFQVTQLGQKNVIPFVYEEETDIETDELNFWVYSYSGNTTIDPPKLPIRDKRQKKDRVHKSVFIEKDKVIIISESASLYKTESITSSVGEVLKPIRDIIWDDVHGWYIVKESGYYFSSDGELTLIAPSSFEGYSCESKKSEFNISLLSTMNNCWDIHNKTLPDWLSVEKISGSLGFDSIKVIIDENIKSENREFALQFYVDSSEETQKSFLIRQSGFEVINNDRELVKVTPIISSRKTAFTSGAFELGLSALLEYSTSSVVNGVEYQYHYSEYKDVGVQFSTSDDMEGVFVTEDSYGKPKLVVSENTSQEARSIEITATYNEVSGSINIFQGSLNEIKYYTYGDNLTVEIPQGFNNLPKGISRFKVSVKGRKTLNTLNLSTKEIVSVSGSSEEELVFPYLIDKLGITSDCGFSLISPDTIEYINSPKREMKIFYPISEYGFIDNELIESSNTIETEGISFNVNQETGTMVVGNTLLSGKEKGNLSTDLSFTYPSINIIRKDQSTDVSNYITGPEDLSSNNSSIEISKPRKLSVTLKDRPTEYLNNKIITFQISDPDSGEILKYIHFRYMRSLPKIECKSLGEPTYRSLQTSAKIQVNSNIGYTSSPWSNSPEGVNIINGFYTTSVAKFEDAKTIEYKSEDQPSRKWYSRYSTESLILRDSDNLGIIKEFPIVLPVGVGEIPGFEIFLGETKITTSQENSYDLYLTSDGGREIFTIKSYEPYTVSVVDKVTSSNQRGIIVEDSRNWIQSIVGSLGEMKLRVGYLSKNTGMGSVLRGSVKLTSPSKSFAINIYQSSGTGIAKVIDPASKILIAGEEKNTITFSHLYPAWEIVQVDSVKTDRTRYPRFNNQGYNKFGNGGNSGNTYTNRDGKTSTVKIEYEKKMLSDMEKNKSLELKPINSCIPESYGITTPNVYGIKTASADTLQSLLGESVKTTDTFSVMIKPENPTFSVYQMEDGNLVESQEIKVSRGLYRDPNDSSVSVKRYIELYVYSDLFERTKSYVGDTLLVGGEFLNIYNQYTVFEKLFGTINLRYGIGEISDEFFQYSKKVYSPTSYFTDTDGKTYAYYKIENLSSSFGSLTGEMSFIMNGFTVDKSYYLGEDITLNLPVKDN